MERRSVVRITLSTLCIFIIFLTVGMWLRIQHSRSSIISPLPHITPTRIPSPTAIPMPKGTPVHFTLSPTPAVKHLPSLTNTPITQIKTPAPAAVSTSTSTTGPVIGSTPGPTTIPSLLSVNPTALDRMNVQPQCKYDTHGGAPYIDCTLTLHNTSLTETATWTASISDTGYTLTPNSGQLAPGKTEAFHFVALPVGCPGSYMITVKGNVNTLHIPITCTDVFINPSGTVSANDICTETTNFTYVCSVMLLAYPGNPVPANWNAAIMAAGGAESITFSPQKGTLASDSSVQITITIVDSQCPVDTVQFSFFVPETPGLPMHNNNVLTWIC